jgi:hypothetical protein
MKAMTRCKGHITYAIVNDPYTAWVSGLCLKCQRYAPYYIAPNDVETVKGEVVDGKCELFLEQGK